MVSNELSDIRAIRRQITAESNGELDRVFDYYENVQSRLKNSKPFQFIDKPLSKSPHKTTHGQMR